MINVDAVPTLNGWGQLDRTFKALQTWLKLLMGLEAAMKMPLVVSARLLGSQSHASSSTAKMKVYLYHKVPSLRSRGVKSVEEGGHRIFAG